MEYLKLGVFSSFSYREGGISDFVNELETQLAILMSIPSVLEVKEMSLRELITADIARTEIEQAEILLENGFERAAGSIAGVALELHLKTLCDINGVSYKPKPTIEPLIQALYNEKKLDISEKKHLEYLGSIRNKCSHSEPVTEKEVKRLIEEVKKLI
jgi:HEPN domain-containing protein